MATILEEPQKQDLTYEEALEELTQISPEWALRIQMYGMEAHYIFRREISQRRVCIVGEAHGSSDYSCYECNAFSGGWSAGIMDLPRREMDINARGTGLLTPEDWPVIIPAFVKHWKEKHATQHTS